MRRANRSWWIACTSVLAGCGSNVIVGTVAPGDASVTPDVAALPDRAPVVDAPALPDITVRDVPPPEDLSPAGCDGVSPPVGTPCSAGVGACLRTGRYLCRADIHLTVCDATPAAGSAETCNGLDDDCNGMVDELAPRSCYSAAPSTMGVGVCRPGTQACVVGAWTPCASEVTPSPELCNGLDDDCNGRVDEGVTRICGDLSWSVPGRYARSVSPRAYVDACAAMVHRTYLPSADDGMVTEALPFAFRAFGQSVTTAYISANGVMGFAAAPWNFMNQTLPFTRGSASVYAFWDDLSMRDGICTTTVGTAPSRTFVIEWHDARFFPVREDAHLSFEVVLEETSGLIDVLYQRMEGEAMRTVGDSATIGIQGDETPALTDMVSFNTARPMLAPSGIRWTPSPVDMRGICRAGRQTCAMGTFGACTGEIGPAMERCGNGLDDDCNGTADDGCP